MGTTAVALELDLHLFDFLKNNEFSMSSSVNCSYIRKMFDDLAIWLFQLLQFFFFRINYMNNGPSTTH